MLKLDTLFLYVHRCHWYYRGTPIRYSEGTQNIHYSLAIITKVILDSVTNTRGEWKID